MSILLVGMNHRTAPVVLREQMAFSQEGVATALMLFRNRHPDCGAMLLCTCNRMELLVVSERHEPSLDAVLSFLAEARDLPVSSFRDALYVRRDMDAVKHLYRVASGLDSMVLGEYQIVSQLKQAYAQASERGTCDPIINRLMHGAFHLSGRARSETEIGRRKVSIPSVAVDMASQVFDDFADKRVLVIGAGDMAQLVCEHLRETDCRHFTVTSRTLNNARALARAFDGRVVPFSQLDEELVDADIVITAVHCPRCILTEQRVREVQQRRSGRLLYIVDLGVPRNVEPEAASVGQVYLQDIDALGRTAAANDAARKREVTCVERIVEQELQRFEQWMTESQARPLISQMFEDARRLQHIELDRFFDRCRSLTDDEREAIEQLTERLVAKLMHPCVRTTKKHCRSEPIATFAQTLRSVRNQHERRTGRQVRRQMDRAG